MNGCQFVGLTIKAAEGNDENDDGDLDDDDHVLVRRAFPNSVNEQNRHRRDDEKRGQIKRDRMPKEDGQSGGRKILRTLRRLSR